MTSALRHRVGRTVRNIRRNRVEGVGHDFVADIRKRLPQLRIKTIFDVGAHIGMTALEFSDEWPEAVVHAFEPHPGNFARMQANLIGKPEVLCHQIGVGEEAGTLPFHFDPAHPSMARVAEDGETTIPVETLDILAADAPQIDLLKIDVEGHEMPVLRGAKQLLSESRIAIIRIETAIDPDLPYHTQLFDICEYLHPYGYRLFGFYEQWEDTINKGPRLRRFDAAFISPKSITASW